MNKRKNAIYKCDNCNKLINGVKAYYIIQHQRKSPDRAGYCSKECSDLGRRTDKVDIKCASCGKKFKRYCTTVSSSNNFCSHSCSAKFNNSTRCLKRVSKKIKTKCLGCNKEILCYNFESRKYCSSKCRANYTYERIIQDWKDGKINGGDAHYGKVNSPIRRYIFNKYNNKCSECGWDKVNPYSGKSPLQIEHINGDAYNHKEENLKLLCPSCHSLTATYGNLNNGKGRKNRKNLTYK